MEWKSIISESVQFIEEHIAENINVDRIAKEVGVSKYYFQRGFVSLCGYTVADYIRNRKMSLAGNDVIASNERIIDIAIKYGYESGDSFTKAFKRFHGVSPNYARHSRAMIKSFSPLNIRNFRNHGYSLDYRIERKNAFVLYGIKKKVDYQDYLERIPEIWQEYYSKYKEGEILGKYGLCLENENINQFDYIISDMAADGIVHDKYFCYKIPEQEWAVFPCYGTIPDDIQKNDIKIYTEWLLSLKDYELVQSYSVEFYKDYDKLMNGIFNNIYSEIWVPIRKKENK